MPIFTFECEQCLCQYEDFCSSQDTKPDNCPECQSDQVSKIMSLPATGKVELYGQDLKAKIKQDTQKLKKQIHSNESSFVNFVGENNLKKSSF